MLGSANYVILGHRAFRDGFPRDGSLAKNSDGLVLPVNPFPMYKILIFTIQNANITSNFYFYLTFCNFVCSHAVVTSLVPQKDSHPSLIVETHTRWVILNLQNSNFISK